jgi:hypothetical protein
LRYRVVELLATNPKEHSVGLRRVEIVLDVWFYLQLLKYSIDYFTLYWLGREQPILVHLNASYYSIFVSELVLQMMLYIAVAFMNIYWLAYFLLFKYEVKLSATGQNMKRILFSVTKNVLFLPLITIILRYCLNNSACSLPQTKSTFLTTATPPFYCSSSSCWAVCLS